MTEMKNNKPVKSRTASRDVRRKQLIMAAIDSISKRGFTGTTLKLVTSGAKLSQGIVNYHFESKETLYVETLGFLVNEHYDLWFESMNAARPDPADQLAAIIEANFHKRVCSPKKLAVWFAFWGQVKYRPNYLKIHNKRDKSRFVELTRLCGEIINERPYENLEAGQIARTLEALIDGLWLDMMLYPSACKLKENRNDCFNLLAKFFPKHFEYSSIAKSDSHRRIVR
ncbi:MAG: TetR family transcriptional regulator [Hyphomicrobiales bacterium]|nr:TetR family transcriptional regulator [Hyphomicrobiales bacterium]